MRNETQHYSSDNLLLAKRIRIFGVRFQTANLANNRRSARKVDRKRLIWQITGVVPEKLIVFNAVGLSIANLRLI